MKKNRKIWIIVLGILGVGILLCCFFIFVKPALYIKNKEKLQSEAGPTAKYLDHMPQTDEIFDWAKELVDMGVRKVGTPNWQRAHDYVLAKFVESGVENVGVVGSSSTIWTCDEWSLSVNGEEVPSYFMSHSLENGSFGSFSTPEGGIRAELVYVGDGTEKDYKKNDVRGKIVVSNVKFMKVPVAGTKIMAHMFYDPDRSIPLTSNIINPYSANTYPYNCFRAMDNGAVGFIGILSDYINSNEYNNEDYSFMQEPIHIPGLWVSRRDGESLVKTINAGNAVAQITMQTEYHPAAGSAVIGFLPGNSPETIMVQSHYDSSTPGAVEDASGTSVVLAIAKFYAAIPQHERKRSLMFVLMDTHFSGYESQEAVNRKYVLDGNVLANVCIEHIANEVREVDGKNVLTGEIDPRIVFVNDNKALVEITNEEIVRHRMGRTAVIPADMFGEDPPTDATYTYQAGVPVISLISAPIYLYDNIDTVDKIAKQELRPTAETFSDIIWRLMELPKDKFGIDIKYENQD